MNLYKIGMTMLGIVSIVFFVGATVILLFYKQFADVYGSTPPPPWMWKTVGVVIIIGVVGFIISLIDLATEGEK